MFCSLIYSSLANIKHQEPASVEEEGRTIYVNDADSNIPFKYAHNKVTTAKYTPLTFFPKNLFEQFCRLANIYFIIISALQVFSFVQSLFYLYTYVHILIFYLLTS
jgi:hypothetical protein